jgi:hypothetical protein
MQQQQQQQPQRNYQKAEKAVSLHRSQQQHNHMDVPRALNLSYTQANHQSKWKQIKKRRIHLKTLNPRNHRRRKRKQGTVY